MLESLSLRHNIIQLQAFTSTFMQEREKIFKMVWMLKDKEFLG